MLFTRITTAKPYKIKSDLLDLSLHGYKYMAKNKIHVTILLMKALLLYQKELEKNIG